jgi:AraC-like DNA-binding protein
MNAGYLALPIGSHNPLARPSHATPSVALLATDLVRVGMVSIPPTHPLFRSGPVPGDMVVFPRTAFRLARQSDRTRTVDASVAVTYRDQQEFRREASTTDGSQGSWIAISPVLRRELCERAGLDGFPATVLPISSAFFGEAQAVFRTLTAPGIDAFAIEERTVLLLHALFRPRTTEPMSSRATRDAIVDLVERTRLLLAQELTSNRSLGEVASSVGASPGHLCRSFFAVTGTTVHAYRRELRLRTAMRWLDDTAFDLTRIALELGFTSHAHFSMWFRRAWGITPSRYRAGHAPIPTRT